MEHVLTPFINRVEKKPGSFEEYASFKDDKVIGSVYFVDWRIALLALIAHELAHAVQCSTIGVNMIAANGLSKKDQTSPHGIVWKKIYSDLRTKFVNNRTFA